MARLLRESLKGELPPSQLESLETGIDVIGDIAIVKLPEASEAGPAVGRAVLASMKNVKAVYDQEGAIEGEFRLRRLRHLAGEARTLTIHRENNLRFKVDVRTCYFSPRLSTERARIADLVADGETVLNMFAGVGPYSITIAKRREVQVYSNELNREAYELHLENNAMNKVEARLRTLNADAAELPRLVPVRFDRILMPHPSQSDRYLAAAARMVRGGGWIHYYRHVSGGDIDEANENLRAEVSGILGEGWDYTGRRVREIGPHYLELVADLRSPP